MAKIELVHCDEKAGRELEVLLRGLGHEVLRVGEASSALRSLKSFGPELLVLADPVPGSSCESVMREVSREAPFLPVLAALSERDAQRAVELMKAGAIDCIAPPWTAEAVKPCVLKALRFPGVSMGLLPDKPSSGSRYYYGGAVLASALFAAGIYFFWNLFLPRTTAMTVSWDLPYSHPAGLAWDGKSFWIADWYTQAVYRHEPSSLNVDRVHAVPGEVPVALAFAEGAVWVAGSSGYAEKRLLDGDFSRGARRKVPGNVPSCLAYDGVYLWSCDARGNVLRRHLLDEKLTAAETFPYPGARPAALAFDGKFLWSLDDSRLELLKHDLQRPSQVLRRYRLPEYSSQNLKPAGLAWDGRYFWSVAERDKGRGRIIRHSLAE